jgi:hypothetical protein
MSVFRSGEVADRRLTPEIPTNLQHKQPSPNLIRSRRTRQAEKAAGWKVQPEAGSE